MSIYRSLSKLEIRTSQLLKFKDVIDYVASSHNCSASYPFFLLADTTCRGPHASHGLFIPVGESFNFLALLVPVTSFQLVGPSDVLMSCLAEVLLEPLPKFWLFFIRALWADMLCNTPSLTILSGQYSSCIPCISCYLCVTCIYIDIT